MIHALLEELSDGGQHPTRFHRYWTLVGWVEDFAAAAETPAQQNLAQMLRVALEDILRSSARRAFHGDAEAVAEWLGSPPGTLGRRRR